MATLHYEKILSCNVESQAKTTIIRFAGESYIHKQKQVLVFEAIRVEDTLPTVNESNWKTYHYFFTENIFNHEEIC